MDPASMVAFTKSIQGLFLGLTVLGLTLYKWPVHFHVQDNAVYDYIVVGAGTGGSIVAHRLSEDPNVKVLLIEAGGDPHWEAQYAGMFTYLTKSEMDWNFTAGDDGYTCQNLRNKYLDLPTAKVLGGSSAFFQYFYIRGHPYDYKLWAEAAGDDSWNWWNLLPYFKKHERLEDQDLINSESACFHGLDGTVGITKETREETLKYMEAFREIGHDIKDDLNTEDALGFAPSLYYIAKDGIRQNNAECFLAPIKDRSNLHLMKNTLVRKVLFDDKLNAIGVECSTPDGNIINVYARKEIILSAGTFNTPKILMLSGIGPKEHLKNIGIPVLYDSPVGKNLEDHVSVVLLHKGEKTNDTVKPQNPSQFPLATFFSISALNKFQDYSDYLTLNMVCKNNPAALLQIGSVLLGLHDDVTKQLAAAGSGREVMLTILNQARPKSTGVVQLRSSKVEDSLNISMGYFSNNIDLENTVAYIQDFIKVSKSSYFQRVGGETMHFDLPRCKGLKWNTTEYWKCYILNMMGTTFIPSSSCRMGSVVDSRLRVMGVKRLRIGDASAVPNQITGNINTAVMAAAEKMSDMIKEDNRSHRSIKDKTLASLKKIYDSIKKKVHINFNF